MASNVMRTPGSPNCRAPRMRYPIPNSVLPQPAPPQTGVARPLGRPPGVISSNLCTPHASVHPRMTRKKWVDSRKPVPQPFLWSWRRTPTAGVPSSGTL